MKGTVKEEYLAVRGQPTVNSFQIGQLKEGDVIMIESLMKKEGFIWGKTTIQHGLMHGWVMTGTVEDFEKYVKLEDIRL